MVCSPKVTRLLSAALLALCPLAALGQQPLTIADVARLQAVGSVAVSPQGGWIAYTLRVQREPMSGDDGGAWTELHVTDASGNSRAYITGDVDVSQVQWTPDGKRLVYVSRRGNDQHATLYALPIDGGESQKLLDHDAAVSSVSFSGDGKWLAFLSTAPLPKAQQDLRSQGFNQEIYEEDWRPKQVWLAPVDGSQPPRALANLPGSAFDVQWNPQQRQLAVALAKTPLVDDSYMFQRVKIVDVDSGHILQHVANPGKLGSMHWSPDGQRLAMISAADLNDPSEGRLMVAAIPGDGTLRELLPDLQAHVTSFAWNEDGALLFLADERTGSRVGMIAPDGATTTWLSSQDLVLGGLSYGGGLLAMTGQSAQHPSEAFALVDRQPRRLTDSNPWLAQRRLARQEVVTWTARDGLKLEGLLIYPLNYQEGLRYPLIMAVHGGPEAHVANGWLTSYSYPGQVGAARNFAVFYPNYRGSTGRGVAFSKLGQGDAAGKEFEDLIDGVDHLIEVGLVDKNRVGITGGSYGGYASAWGATYYSDRFAASAMFVGISDNVSKVGTTDIPEEMFLVHHRKRLWEDWSYFLERSPIRHVQKNRTPTLILHGKDDPRVHPSQSMELFRHLKTLGQAPVRLVFYPGEGHGNRRAASRLDYHIRMLQWMEHYLQGPGGPPPEYQLDYAAAVKQ